MKKSIFILGVGHNTPVIMELAEINGYNISGLYHFEKGREGEKIKGIEIIGCYDDLFVENNFKGVNFALSMGDNLIRVQLSDEIRKKSGSIPSLIHPSAFISKYAEIKQSVVINANTTIQPDVIICEDTYISFNVGVAHNTIIEKGCYVASQTIIGAYTHVFEKVFIGQGSVITSGKVHSIGKNAIIGAGSVVIKPVKENQTVIGNPAKEYTRNG